jgi:hypothetical protein
MEKDRRATIKKTNKPPQKKCYKQITENWGAKIFKRLGAILSRKTKEEKIMASMLKEIIKIRKEIINKKKQ